MEDEGGREEESNRQERGVQRGEGEVHGGGINRSK